MVRRRHLFVLCIVLIQFTGCKDNTPQPTVTAPAQSAAGANAKSAADRIVEAQSLLSIGQVTPAKELLQSALMMEPKNIKALELSGDIALHERDGNRAAELFEAAMQNAERPSVALINKVGGQWMSVGRPFKALTTIENALAVYPDDAEIRKLAIGTMKSLGLEREALPHLQWLVQRGHGGLNYLTILTDLNRPQTDKKTCEYALKSFPDDLRPAYALARVDAYASQWEAVRDQLKPVVARHPDFLPAHSFYARALVELNDKTDLDDWLKVRPKGIESRPQYWIAAGIWADRNGKSEQATKAFGNAVSLDENNLESLSLLAGALRSIDREEDSKLVDDRLRQLIVVRDAVDQLFAWRRNSQAAAVKLSKGLHDLGRPWEATVWLQVAQRMSGQQDESLPTVYARFRGELTGATPWQEPEALLAAKLDLAELDSFTWGEGQDAEATKWATFDPVHIQFRDQANERGLKHLCEIKHSNENESGIAIYQTGAGGVGVIDFDLDGWADIYLTNSNGTPLRMDSKANQLFRNLKTEFARVTRASRVGDAGFAQGIAIGDYNNDGFPDIFVGNIGQNRIYRNNGDGSFQDVTEQAGVGVESDWTTSSALADLDGDGHADLFQLAYCDGDAAFTQDCIDKNIKQPRSCVPVAFEAKRDRVFKGVGDGSFRDVTQQWLGEHQPGFGLGIVVGALDNDAGLDVFVANDTTANHYWSRTGEHEQFSLAESGTVRGLAFNASSIAQASMGVAAGDADRDGDVDFFVTHFTADYHTFYQQVRPGMWSDRTTALGLARPTYDMLGFGTQLLDADNDGSTEVLVGNGNIDDFTHDDLAFRMPPQLFHRKADGRWTDLESASLGQYFQQKRLARGMATLDANRDGKQDAVVTHLYDPVALLVNESETPGKSVRIHLRATTSQRDAIGTRVKFKIAGQWQAATLLGGDGYYCSNEKCLTIGVGDAAQIDDVVVEWPNGQQTTIGVLKSDSELLIVEGVEGKYSFKE